MAQTKQDIDELLADSLKALAASRPIEKITIKEITDKAGVIRPTFYNHFQDKYELIEWIVEHELINPVRPLLSNNMINAAIMLLLMNVEKEKRFYMAVAKMEGQDTFETIATRQVAGLLEEIMEKGPEDISGDHPWMTKHVVANYFAKSMCYVVKEWVDSGMAIPAKEMADVYELLVSTSLDTFLGKRI